MRGKPPVFRANAHNGRKRPEGTETTGRKNPKGQAGKPKGYRPKTNRND